MKNIKGANGVINKTGTEGAPSHIVDCREKDFYSNIEENIKDTVKCLIEAGFMTFSSCEGHSWSPIRNVSLVVNDAECKQIQKMIYHVFKDSMCGVIHYAIRNYDVFELYNDLYTQPKVISIFFGSIYCKDTLFKQEIFNNAIKNKLFNEYNNELWDNQMENDFLIDGKIGHTDSILIE